jgi:stage II sporulation protein AB (anti-sigma F factor)
MNELHQSERTGGGRSRKLRLHLPPNPRAGRHARERISGFARANAIPEPDIDFFILAVGEALANAFEHAQSTSEIEVSCWIVNDDQLLATVVDRGTGFVAPAVETVEMPSDPFAERGRGFSIMRRCTDQVAVRSLPGGGTSVILVRYVRHRRSSRGTARSRPA